MYALPLQRQSDWAKLGLVLRDGQLISIKDTLVSPSEQTLVTPASRNVDKSVDKGDDDDEYGEFSLSLLRTPKDAHAQEPDDVLCFSLPYAGFDDIPLSEAHETQDPMAGGCRRPFFGEVLPDPL